MAWKSSAGHLAQIAATAIFTFASCSKQGPTDADTVWLATKAADSLARTFRSVGLDASQRETGLSVAGKKVDIAVRIHDRVEQGRRQMIAAEFNISVDGTPVPTLTAVSVGVDDTPDGARNTAAAEWAAQYGAPIAFAIAAELDAARPPVATDSLAPFYNRVEIDGQVLFHSPPGLRGTARDPAAVVEFVRQLVGPVVRSLQRTPHSSAYRSSTILVAVTGAAVTRGECRVDGRVSSELLDTLSKLSWPEGSPSYMFKLFFVGPATPG